MAYDNSYMAYERRGERASRVPPAFAPSPTAFAATPVQMTSQPPAMQFTVPQVACKVNPSEPVQFFDLATDELICAEEAVRRSSAGAKEVTSIKKAYPHVRKAIEEMLETYSERLDEIK